MQPMGACVLLYCVKWKMAQNDENFIVLLCFHVNTFFFVFPEMAGRGTLATP